MSKRLRRILASLLVLTLFVASMPFAALSETAPAEEFAAEATEAPAEEPEAESTEAPVEESVAESTEAPVEESVAESTEAPVEEPAAESTEAPVEESVAESTEAPAEEPEEESTEVPAEEPEAEATEMPAEEPEAEATEAPIEEPSNELSDAQKAALENLPAGFSAGTVALAMMQSSGCEHTNLRVNENSNERQYSSINDEKHLCTYTVKSRTLKCTDCGQTLQTITVNETITEEGRHKWGIKSVGEKITIECDYCQKTKTISKPCSHNSFGIWEDGNLYCTQCLKESVLNPEQTYCKHTNYTEYGTKNSPIVEYEAFSKEQHVKHSDTMTFIDGYGFAICDDCGIELELKNGKVTGVGITDYPGDDLQRKSVLESHTFENGACKYCGETMSKDCDHSAGNYRDELDESVAPKYLNITDTTHCVQYSYKRYCKDCGAYIQNVLDEGATPVAHDFSKGDTCVCGYSKQEDDEQKPYVRGFKMSKTSVKVGDTVKFTLDIANFKDGETVKLQFRADEWTEDFNLTAPNNVFEHQFSRAGNRPIQFRVVDGEWCSAQTLKVTAQAAEVKTMRLSSTYIEEQKDGGTITATVTCNNATSLVDLYVNDKRVKQSSTYTEENGNRVFTISFKLGGNGKYAGEYKIRAAALKEAYGEWDNSDVVTLTVKHNYKASGKDEFKDYWKKSADGHTRYRQATAHYVCQVCNAEDERSGKCAIGSLQPHTFDNDTGECTVCGYKKINPPQDDPKMSTDYKESEFYQKLKKVNLTGDYAEDIVNVARSQIGYTETGNNNTVYGAFTGGNNLSWCASFVSWCASKAGLSDVFKIGTAANPDWVLKKGYLVWYFAEYPSWKSKNAEPGEGFHYFMSGADVKEYDPDRNIVIPQKGDLVFFATVQKEPWAHIGIVTDYDSATQTITYIDGNGTDEGTRKYPAKLIAGETENIAVSEWKIGLKNQNICAIARPNY